jgi:hypothetical protein
MAVNIRLGDLDIEVEHLQSARCRVSVALAGARLPGSATEASDADVLHAAQALIKFVGERQG